MIRLAVIFEVVYSIIVYAVIKKRIKSGAYIYTCDRAQDQKEVVEKYGLKLITYPLSVYMILMTIIFGQAREEFFYVFYTCGLLVATMLVCTYLAVDFLMKIYYAGKYGLDEYLPQKEGAHFYIPEEKRVNRCDKPSDISH